MQNDEKRIAVFIDFENVAMGVRESKYGNFNIDLVLKRLVEKGKIMVKRAYSDWHRYAEFKRAFHQAAIELIDVPQTRYSGKNSADIRMVVDALDLSYQKEHIDTFVLVSGDSDFSPLVSKLRENGRYVIGMGVKQSSSDLLINNCDEFIFYEDLVRPTTTVTVVDPQVHHLSPKKAEAIRLVLETFQALQREGKEVIYGSMIKQTLIRKLPSFNETYYGYPMFSRLLEDAAENKLLKLAKDQKSGGYIVTTPSDGATGATPETTPSTPPAVEVGTNGSAVAQAALPTPIEPRDRFRRGRWDRSRSQRGDRYGDSQTIPPATTVPESLTVPSGVTDPLPEVAESAPPSLPNPASESTSPEANPIEGHPTSEAIGPAAEQPRSAELSSASSALSVPVTEAAAPAPTSQDRGHRGIRRQARFRQAAATVSGHRTPAAPKSTEASPALAEPTGTTGGTALASPRENSAAKADAERTSAPSRIAKGKSNQRSRSPRSNRQSGNKKKPA